ncbi:MAG: hypothetical protein AAGA54_27605 [Myxococcota bacterium]
MWLLTNRTAYAAERNWVRDELPVGMRVGPDLKQLRVFGDQRANAPLVGGERVGLLNLVPEGAIAFTLRSVRFEAVEELSA